MAYRPSHTCNRTSYTFVVVGHDGVCDCGVCFEFVRRKCSGSGWVYSRWFSVQAAA
jgi:hypothetical protein